MRTSRPADFQFEMRSTSGSSSPMVFRTVFTTSRGNLARSASVFPPHRSSRQNSLIPEELIEEVAVAGVNLDTIKLEFHAGFRRFDKRIEHGSRSTSVIARPRG